MATTQGANEFTLSVEFAGVCLYVIDDENPTKTEVPVLMPNCLPTDGRDQGKHEDGTDGARHVPYLLMDLANLDPRVTTPGLLADGPKFQVVRRLSREEIIFGLPPGGIELVPDPLPLPDLDVYKDTIRLKPNLLSTDPLKPPPIELQARTIVKGGKLEGTIVGGAGVGRKRDKWDEDAADWAGSIKWTRERIPGNSLSIGIRSLVTGEETPLPPLRPVNRGDAAIIELKIASLCETNPLEWKEFKPRFEKEDEDFKWLFRLFEARDGGTLLNAIRRVKLPYPKLTSGRRARTTGNTGCTGGKGGG